MVQNSQELRRPRGRPRVRDDEETKAVVLSSARQRFLADGYASCCVNNIAQDAGVSTKTVYRLFPSKSEIFEAFIVDRIALFGVDVDHGLLKHTSVREGLQHLLEAYGRLTLDPETIAITRVVTAEAERFPEIAAVYYERAVRAAHAVFENWLKSQVAKGTIAVADPSLAAGMLKGMMTMEPQRAALLGQRPPPDAEEIRARAAQCAAIFLDGCEHRSC